MEKAIEAKITLDAIRKSMGKCEIPVNIAHRADEIQNLNEKLKIIADEL